MDEEETKKSGEDQKSKGQGAAEEDEEKMIIEEEHGQEGRRVKVENKVKIEEEEYKTSDDKIEVQKPKDDGKEKMEVEGQKTSDDKIEVENPKAAEGKIALQAITIQTPLNLVLGTSEANSFMLR